MDLILDEETALGTYLARCFHLTHLEHFTEEQQDLIDDSAEMLYGLVHARFILSTKGMQQMVCQAKISRTTLISTA